jgi:hypothetical protein
MACRTSAHASFRCAAEDLQRLGQIRLTHETLRVLVEAEGARAQQAQHAGCVRPTWSAEDCRESPGGRTCVITGADGVLVPLVTEAEKAKRRGNRRKRGPKARRRRRRIRRGADQAYKEFKVAALYDASKPRQYALGTSGDHQALGRLMRRGARRIRLDRADVSYSVTDGAEWIRNQYRRRLPMLEANVLDYYHLREHVSAAARAVFGEGGSPAADWREQMMGVVLEEGPLALLERVGELRRSLRAKSKRAALESLRTYVAKRMEMLDYPTFLAKDYDIGSGPTESWCKTLTARLKGPGMRWDRPHAEALMALASLRASNLWRQYWSSPAAQAA